MDTILNNFVKISQKIYLLNLSQEKVVSTVNRSQTTSSHKTSTTTATT